MLRTTAERSPPSTPVAIGLWISLPALLRERQRDQCQPCGEGRHQDRVQALKRSSLHCLVERDTFGEQVVVVGNETNPVPSGALEQGDEAHLVKPAELVEVGAEQIDSDARGVPEGM